MQDLRTTIWFTDLQREHIEATKSSLLWLGFACVRLASPRCHVWLGLGAGMLLAWACAVVWRAVCQVVYSPTHPVACCVEALFVVHNAPHQETAPCRSRLQGRGGGGNRGGEAGDRQREAWLGTCKFVQL